MLGNRLRELRKKHNKTQAELGKLLGTDQSGYSKIENSIHSLPVSLLGILANYYRMSSDELLEFTPNNPQTDAEKALSKLDDYGIIYKIFNDGRIGILQPKNVICFIPMEQLPEIIQLLEKQCDDSLKEIKAKIFKAALTDYLQNTIDLPDCIDSEALKGKKE